MDVARAKRLAEAKKYRLQVRLSLVRQQADRSGDAALKARVDALRGQVDAVAVADDEVTSMAARNHLAELEPQVLGLQSEAGIPDHGLSVLPRWLEFTLWTTPVILLFGALAVVFALRRRKREVDEATLAALEASAED